ncbi:LuxR family transcriptional regulator [Notoacmeibacter sp. MSK16QG-6]|uniref:LuxR family transcriptional regulator n=1 Tax=Notoacmeibacter sp. MSK16QG-6 TaxID=2957982 RepID=UPI003530768C
MKHLRTQHIPEFFLERVSVTECCSKDRLLGLLHDVCDCYHLGDITYYGCTRRANGDASQCLLTTYCPEWVSHYFQNGYESIDPLLTFGPNSLHPIQWSSVDLNRSTSEFFSASRDFGIGSKGITISVRGLRQESALVSYSKECSDIEWKSYCNDLISDLYYLSSLIHEQAVLLQSSEIGLAGIRLSTRETETLSWAARGKTAWETAQILGLSEKTVQFYLSNACTKLGTTTKTHAVATAISEHMIKL